ncbi:uncharacterized protein EDB91DRAFT_1303578 [Suillus paluster]|uniref:uncharacterized protein n=1 Tax=Suillus paluster TaxID=48578 RepID=UPI001B87B41D|nr:uncharacterized protein EDB91DRAFT_1303578 [Suillus paluster]KAG1750431.1 hypothetical protein EDB91DRAFT_1303578 [Suillus paluster]
MYYTTIPLVSERPNNRCWDASKLHELQKRLDSGTMTVEETDQVAGDFLDGEIVDLASDWLGNTVGIPTPSPVAMARFTPHLSHLCTHKLASLTVVRIVNQKIEFKASRQIVQALFLSPGGHVLTDVLGDQVNGVAVVHEILTSPFIDPIDKPTYIKATKWVLIELLSIALADLNNLKERFTGAIQHASWMNRSDSTQLTSACDEVRWQYVFSPETKAKQQGRISTCSNEASSTPLSPISSPALHPLLPRLPRCFFSPPFAMIFSFAKPHSLSLLAPPGSCKRDPSYSTTKSGLGPWAFAIIIT